MASSGSVLVMVVDSSCASGSGVLSVVSRGRYVRVISVPLVNSGDGFLARCEAGWNESMVRQLGGLDVVT